MLQKAKSAVCFESFLVVNTAGVEFSHVDSAFVLNRKETKVEVPMISFSSEAAGGSPFLLSSVALREDPNSVKRLFSVIDDHDALGEIAEELDAADNNEGKAEVVYATGLIKPLVGYCHPSKHGKKAHLYEKTDLEVKFLGMGEKRCWHGHGNLLASPTPRLDWSTFITTSATSEDNDIFLGIDSKPDQKYLNQAIGETIMHSFVRHNLHSAKQSMVPGLLLSRSSFWVILYDCVADTLLVSDCIPFIRDSVVYTPAIAVLWLVLHHGMFMNKNAVTEDSREKYESGFLREAKRQETLRYYTSEKSFTKKYCISLGNATQKVAEKRKAAEGQFFETSPYKKMN